MKKNNKITILIFFLLLLYSKNFCNNSINILKDQQINCSEFTDCFNCTSCGEYNVNNCYCYYSSNYCKNKEVLEIYKNWWEYFSTCVDDPSYNIQLNYCGNSLIQFENNNSINFTPPFYKYNNKSDIKIIYGGINLYCFYYFEEKKDNIDYILSVYKYNNNIENNISYPYISYVVTRLKNKKNVEIIKETIVSNFSKITYSKTKRIDFYIYYENYYNFLPFYFYIEKKTDKKNIWIIVVIIIIIICLFILGLNLCLINKRFNIFNNNLRNDNNNNLNSNTVTININDEQKKKENLKKIKNLFEKNGCLKSKIYSKEYENKNKINNKCSICLEKFFINISNISITPCNHIFHSNCLQRWLKKNYLRPKCPNCNYNLFMNRNIQRKSFYSCYNDVRRNSKYNIKNKKSIKTVVSNKIYIHSLFKTETNKNNFITNKNNYNDFLSINNDVNLNGSKFDLLSNNKNTNSNLNLKKLNKNNN